MYMFFNIIRHARKQPFDIQKQDILVLIHVFVFKTRVKLKRKKLKLLTKISPLKITSSPFRDGKNLNFSGSAWLGS